MKPRILVVEDEFITAADIENRLGEMGCEVAATVDTGEAAVAKAGELAPDLVLMDITLAGRMTGIEAAGEIGRRFGTPVIFLTAHSEHSTVSGSLASNPYGYIVKPFEASGLRISIEMALYKHRMEEQLRESERTIRCLLNAIPDPLALLDRARKVVAVNDAMAWKIGKGLPDLLGAGIDDLVATGAVRVSPGEMDLLFMAGKPVHAEETVNGRW